MKRKIHQFNFNNTKERMGLNFDHVEMIQTSSTTMDDEAKFCIDFALVSGRSNTISYKTKDARDKAFEAFMAFWQRDDDFEELKEFLADGSDES